MTSGRHKYLLVLVRYGARVEAVEEPTSAVV